MLSKIALLAVAVPVAGTATVLSANYVIVDVRTHGPNAVQFTLPVPIALAETAAAFIPDKARKLRLPAEARRNLSVARGVLAEIEKSPDFELVRVEDGPDQVLVRKVGQDLEVDVSEGPGRGRVHVRLPLAATAELLRGLERGEAPSAAAFALLRASRGEIVRVADAEADVRVRVW